MLLELARSRKILFFGGKGGVGKTTVSAACALSMADEGHNVLLVSTDPAHNLGHLFDHRIGPKPVRLAPGLNGMELDPGQTVNDHLKEVGSALRRLMPPNLSGEVDKHIELSRDAPGMQEAALLERIAGVVEQADEYDLMVFDTAPSGHTARLMALPEMMSAWTEGLIQRRDRADRFNAVLKGLSGERDVEKRILGDDTDSGPDRDTKIRGILNRRQQRFRNLRDVLGDSVRTAFVIVLAAERMPVLESIELHAQLRRAGVHVGGLVVNKRIPDSIDAPFFVERRAQEEAHLRMLANRMRGMSRQDLPLVAHDVTGLEALRRFAGML